MANEDVFEALQPMITKLEAMKSTSDIGSAFSQKEGIKSIIGALLKMSPSDSRQMLQQIISSKKTDSSPFPWIHYGVSMELLIAGLLLVFKPDLFIQIFQLTDIDDGKYDYMRTTGLVCVVLGIHYFFEARHRVNPLIRVAAYVRVLLGFVFAYFVHRGWVEKPIMSFGIGDFITGLLEIRGQSKL